jgi:thiosulfate dehydrogenase
MHAVDTAAAFVKHNMPLGLSGSLTDQESWDVAAYINSHERPQDPRFTGNLQQTAEEFHGSKFSLYGKAKGPDGALLGEHPADSSSPSAGK